MMRREEEKEDEVGGEPRRRVGEAFCNGKLRHEKVVKRGRATSYRCRGRKKNGVEETLI